MNVKDMIYVVDATLESTLKCNTIKIMGEKNLWIEMKGQLNN